MEIKDFENGVTLTHQHLLILKSESKLTKQQKPYLKLDFADKTGEINGNLWDATDEQIQNIKAGLVIDLNGQITEYQNRLQVNIDELHPSENQDLESVLPAAPESYEKLKTELMDYYHAIHNPVYQVIVKELIKAHEHEFLTWPAAKSVHHNFYHGLLFHTISILRQLDHFGNQYPQLNKELMFAGALIHDMGKTIELSGVLNTEYTTDGKLLGHIAIIDGEINRIAEKNNIAPADQSLVLLRHMVLSHHGKLEYGSPVEPQLLEAVALHQADIMDAQMNTIGKSLLKVKPNEWTEKIWSQNNHQFLNHQEGETYQQL